MSVSPKVPKRRQVVRVFAAPEDKERVHVVRLGLDVRRRVGVPPQGARRRFPRAHDRLLLLLLAAAAAAAVFVATTTATAAARADGRGGGGRRRG